MTIRTELEKSGRWVATIPEVPGARSQGSTRLDAAIEAAARALVIRCKHEPEEVWKANFKGLLKEILIEAGDTPVHIKEVNGGTRC